LVQNSRFKVQGSGEEYRLKAEYSILSRLEKSPEIIEGGVPVFSRRAKSPEVIEGGGARRGSESGRREQASGRAGFGEPLAVDVSQLPTDAKATESRRSDLNRRPAVYETAALPAELRRRETERGV
jgi:hypothetical protein